jgi:hypothetical protein
MFLSPLGERLGEGVMHETVFELTPSPILSPKGERSLKAREANRELNLFLEHLRLIR